MRSTNQIVKLALLNEIDAMLAECTEQQRQRFGQLFPDLQTQSESDLKNILMVCQRTVTKNVPIEAALPQPALVISA